MVVRENSGIACFAVGLALLTKGSMCVMRGPFTADYYFVYNHMDALDFGGSLAASPEYIAIAHRDRRLFHLSVPVMTLAATEL